MSKNQTNQHFRNNYNRSQTNKQSNGSNGTWINYRDLNATLRQENDNLKTSIENLQKSQRDMNTRFENLFEENQSLLQEIQRLNNKLSEFNDIEKIKEDNLKLSKLYSELLEESKRMRDDAAKAPDDDKIIEELEKLRKTTTEDIEYMRSKDCIIENLNGIINHLQSIIKDKDMKLQQIVIPELGMRRKNFDSLEKCFTDLKKSHEMLAYKYADLSAKHEELKKIHWTLYTNNAELQKAYQEIQQELNVAHQCLELYFVGEKPSLPIK